MLTYLDYAVILIYFAGVAAFGIKAGGRQLSTSDYFLGSRNLPWWAVCFSVVATETSTLTVIGIPAVAYGGSLTFLQLTFGYIIGRILVSIIFLPQ
ncbi:MAG: sodium:solute symporter, partial [Rhodothermales bacterium]